MGGRVVFEFSDRSAKQSLGWADQFLTQALTQALSEWQKQDVESIFTEDVDIAAAKSIIRLLTVRTRLLEECWNKF